MPRVGGIVTAMLVKDNRAIRAGDPLARIDVREARLAWRRAGSRLLSVVPAKSIYVVANSKETQTRALRPGQRADVYVDALGDTLRGSVESLAPGSGSKFTLLPFEPGSDNFTKIVQRVGVRIRLDAGQAALAELRPGLSVTAKVRLRS
ncbi:HlyD family efflux transporter periplasmic adaptor subunit [Sphingopyxis sp. JAI128]|uniref:HlyD family secretion protein n=1 Tax=Sphingopyxis sp. JAI128 TaxID=2723066 RepID=UPI00178F74B0|nr:HlyD family efflux transporter periplasmic adaptor subunit [Sphingopyxis sp. JAI128]MBB6427048.1 multidrug resistance efflux pump [Sphingopyxis sp. JAI128]